MIELRGLRREARPFARVALGGALLGLLLACGQQEPAPSSSPEPGLTEAPEVDLGGVRFPEQGLPDPCEILRAAGAEQLLVKPLEKQPMRFEDLCLVQVDRHGAPVPQTSAALELATRDRPQPASLADYFVDFGEGPIMAGATREDVEALPGLGDFAVWFPHADGSLTLSAFWGGKYFLSLEVHGVDRQVAFAWSKAIAEQVIERMRSGGGGRA